MTQIPIHTDPSVGLSKAPDQMMKARQTALRMEASFLSEMLKSAGFDGQKNTFSGSNSEDLFVSFHREAIAKQMVQAGGIGLSEYFFKAMMEAGNDRKDS